MRVINTLIVLLFTLCFAHGVHSPVHRQVPALACNLIYTSKGLSRTCKSHIEAYFQVVKAELRLFLGRPVQPFHTVPGIITVHYRCIPSLSSLHRVINYTGLSYSLSTGPHLSSIISTWRLFCFAVLYWQWSQEGGQVSVCYCVGEHVDSVCWLCHQLNKITSSANVQTCKMGALLGQKYVKSAHCTVTCETCS